jgi:mannose-6-phosphate isomerase-like protein (cupin superfamily)
MSGGKESFMSTTTSSARPDSVFWQDSLMKIKARAGDTGGALGVLEGAFYHEGYGPPLHVHSREDEVIYVLEGQIRFRVGEDEFVAGPGDWVWQPRGVPHSFRVESDSARALVIFTPGGGERMFEEGGVPADESAEPPEQQEYDLEAAVALSKKFGVEFVGPQVGTASP